MKINKKIAFVVFAFWCAGSYAAENTFAGDSVITTIKSAMEGASAEIAKTALIWLGAFATIQLVVTHIGLLKSGADIEAVFGKLLGSLAWIGFCVYVLLNGADFINSVGNGLYKIIDGKLLSASDIIIKALATALKLFGVVIIAAALPGVGNTIGPFFTYTLIFFLAVSVLFAFKIFMVQLELGLIVMLAPLSFSFLGLNALKEQGIAPFKALISLAYRIILMMVIMKAFNSIDGIMWDAIVKYAKLDYLERVYPSNIEELGKAICSGIISYMLLAYLLFKSDSIAATLSSGTTNMGTADVASAAAAGAAAGAAIATGGASLASTNAGKSMADMLKGADSSVADASKSGGGGKNAATELSKPTSPVASQGGGGGSATPSHPPGPGGAPARTDGLAVGGESPAAGGGESPAAGGGESPAAAGGDAAGGDATGGESPSAAGGDATGGESPSAAAAAGGEAAPTAAASVEGGSATGGGSPAAVTAAGGNTASPAAAPSAAGDTAKPSGSSDSAESAAPGQPVADSGSGASAEIGGGGGDSEVQKTLARMEAQLSKQDTPRKSSFKENLGKLNNQIAQERGTTQVSINANASD